MQHILLPRQSFLFPLKLSHLLIIFQYIKHPIHVLHLEVENKDVQKRQNFHICIHNTSAESKIKNQESRLRIYIKTMRSYKQHVDEILKRNKQNILSTQFYIRAYLRCHQGTSRTFRRGRRRRTYRILSWTEELHSSYVNFRYIKATGRGRGWRIMLTM